MVFEHLTEKEARMYVEQMMIDGLTVEEAFDEVQSIDCNMDEA